MATEFVQPVYWWSQLSHATCALHLDVGKALAVALGGSQPPPKTIAALKRQLRRATELLDAAEKMKTEIRSSDAKADVATFDREPRR